MDPLSLFDPGAAMGWLTLGLLVFAGVQVGLQARHERQRRLERSRDQAELEDRAFQYAWAEHFRLEGLADRLRRDDLIEMAFLGVLKPSDVLPHDWPELTRAFASLGREAGYLGGVAAALCHDVARAVAIFTGSVAALAPKAPNALSPGEKVRWLRKQHGEALEPWEESIRKMVEQLSLLTWDAARQSPRANVERDLDFQEDLTSDFGKVAVSALKARASLGPSLKVPAPLGQHRGDAGEGGE